MKFSNLKTGKRLGIAFGAIALLTMALVLVTLASLDNINREWAHFNSAVLTKEAAIANGREALGEGIQNFKNYVLRVKDYDQRFMTDMRAIDDAAAKYESAGALSTQEKEALGKVKKGANDYRAAIRQAVEMKTAGKSIEEIDQSIKGADKAIKDALNELKALAAEDTKRTGITLTTVINNGAAIAIGGGALTLVLTAIAAVLTTRSITIPLAEAVSCARKVSAGDLSQRITTARQDEAGDLLRALSDMNASLVGIVMQVRHGTDNIANASGQITSGNLALSSRTEEQASSLEETASSMEELTSTVRQNADNARQANSLTVAASDVAMRGGQVVSEVVQTMESITGASRKIVDIISVIDGIAFQTNILALNAAVEAARAGEQGRGFAVVAAEVRTLAQRSAAAAKEIKELINDSVEKVDAGSRLVHQAGATMDEIVDSVKHVTDIMAEIMAASDEQSTGIEQINQAISQMDHTTQQNAAMVEEAAAAAEALQEQAESLARTVGLFKLNETTDAASTSSASPVPTRSSPPKPSLSLVKTRVLPAA